MAEVTIRPSKNGPYIVEGPVDLFDTDGNKISVDKLRIALAHTVRLAFKRPKRLILKVPSDALRAFGASREVRIIFSWAGDGVKKV
jgi:hypothetical protein